ncbi:MAG: hypothetical protein Fur0018_22720 [Anaerolineales bacterium]
MSRQELPLLPDGFEYRLDLRHHVTPRLLKDQPVHRWFWFPHSFSPQLVDEVLKISPLPPNGRILDPFVGAGTTVLRALELGYQAGGSDLSPLSLFVSRVKLENYDAADLQAAFEHVRGYRLEPMAGELPTRLQRAFTPDEMAHFHGLQKRFRDLPPREREFFRLALLRVQQQVSRARPDGGWFRWVEREDQSTRIWDLFATQVQEQIKDLDEKYPGGGQVWQDDARTLEKVEGLYDWVITSPPYPNRHDYSRIFHVELLTLGLSEEEIRAFRFGSIRSHVEAHAPALQPEGYAMPLALQHVLEQLPPKADPRIEPLLRGYFEDMYLVLKALQQRLKPGANLAFVVGNVRHAGVMVPVDEILAEIGKQAGYTFTGVWVARLRGNSAQQMGRFGREPARESVVLLRKGL